MSPVSGRDSCLWSLLFVSCVLRLASAASSDVIVDDKAATYEPVSDEWFDQPFCQRCTAPPDPSKFNSGSWTTTTYDGSTEPQNITFSFTGTALYVFGALDQTQNAHYIFFLDEEMVHTYAFETQDTANKLQPFLYNQTLYSNVSIPDGPHTFRLQNGWEGVNSFILFDYLVYTTDNQQTPPAGLPTSMTASVPSASHSPNAPGPGHSDLPIIALSIALPLIAVTLLITFFCLRRRRARASLTKVERNSSNNAEEKIPSLEDSSQVLHIGASDSVASEFNLSEQPNTASDLLSRMSNISTTSRLSFDDTGGTYSPPTHIREDSTLSDCSLNSPIPRPHPPSLVPPIATFSIQPPSYESSTRSSYTVTRMHSQRSLGLDSMWSHERSPSTPLPEYSRGASTLD